MENDDKPQDDKVIITDKEKGADDLKGESPRTDANAAEPSEVSPSIDEITTDAPQAESPSDQKDKVEVANDEDSFEDEGDEKIPPDEDAKGDEIEIHLKDTGDDDNVDVVDLTENDEEQEECKEEQEEEECQEEKEEEGCTKGSDDEECEEGNEEGECEDHECSTADKLSYYIKFLENDALVGLGQTLESVREDEKTVDEEASAISKELENQCSEINMEIDTAKKNMLQDISADRENRQRYIKGKKEQLVQHEKKLRDLLAKCKDQLENGGEEMQRFFDRECFCLQDFCCKYSSTKPTYKTGVIDIPELKKAIGDLTLGTSLLRPPLMKTTLITYPDAGLSETNAEVLLRFNTHTIIQDIRKTSSGEVWITDEDTHYIVKYNSEGEMLKQVDSTCNNECFVIDKDGNFLVCNYWDDKIMKVTQDGDVSVFIDDLPAPPTGICINHEDNIVVCMKDYRWIPIYSPDGKVKKKQMGIREPNNEDNKNDEDVVDDDDDDDDDEDAEGIYTRAVCQIDSPYRIVQNHRRDYIIVDGKFRYQLICLDEDGNFRWKYISQQLEDVYPYNICCTKDDDIIIADVETQRFQIINREGQFVTYIMYKELGLEDAWSMSMDNTGRLWSGQDDGIVNIIELNLGLRPY